MKYLLIYIILTCIINCTGVPENGINEEWFANIQNTQWENTNSEKLVFNSTGKKAESSIFIFTHYNSNTKNEGIYFTQVEIQPMRWYLFQKKDSILTQFGPFLYSNTITTNTDLFTIWNLIK